MKMTDKEKTEWIELCEYIKKNILKYDDSIKFPSYLALRLKGLRQGNFISNKHIKPNASYTYKEILLTAKFVKQNILNYFIDNSAKITDEQHKINLIIKFIENDINNIVIRLKNAEDSNKKVEKIETTQTTTTTKYTAINTKSAKVKDYEDLW